MVVADGVVHEVVRAGGFADVLLPPLIVCFVLGSEIQLHLGLPVDDGLHLLLEHLVHVGCELAGEVLLYLG